MVEREGTLEKIRERGIRAPITEFGPVGMVRFLRQFETGHGDYTAEKHQWLDDPDMRTSAAEIQNHDKDSNV
jgi:hypothetical protein